MKRVVFLLLFLALFAFAKDFTIASYNVENLFDLNKNRSDYKEYFPNTKSNWNKKTYKIKLNNIIKVIKDIDADIIALQEIENKQLLKILQKKLPQYKYISFAKYKNASIGLGFLSKIKILSSKTINIKFSNKIYRPILESSFLLDKYEFKVFNNHWPSKKVAESFRIKYAKRLFDRVKALPKDYDYILTGDFNSNYNEYKTIFYEKRLNNTNSITGINHLLNTIFNNKLTNYEDMKRKEENLHYNLWLDIDYENRFSTIYKGQNNTPDNIILPASLFDNKKISYKTKSFEVFKNKYLYQNRKIYRWQIKNRVHQGSGFSDHLPILAKFTSNKKEETKTKKEKITKISQLYKYEKLNKNILLEDVIVIYKNKNSAIIKQKNDRAIYIYKKAQGLKEGFLYDIKVKQIKDFEGLKEIEDFYIIKEKKRDKAYKNLYIDAKKINLQNKNYQNEIITKLEGIYKKRFFYYKEKNKEKRIKIYFKNKNLIPKKGSKILIKKAQIGFYKNQIQLVIHEKKDFIIK